jgi:phage terminase Nu1 subunit (DNA packaging protein)
MARALTKKEDDELVTQSEFGRRLRMTRQRVSRFVKEGAIPTNADGKIVFMEGVVALIDHLSEVASGRGGGSAQAELSKERALLARAQRENLELRNRTLKDEWVLTADVQRMVDRMVISFRNRMLSIHSWISTSCPHFTRADLTAIDDAIREVLTQLADEEEALEGQLIEEKKKCRK